MSLLVALIEPGSLLGQGLREALGAEGDLDILLLGGSGEDFGTLTRLRDAATIVRPLSAESLADADLVITCGDAAQQRTVLGLVGAGTPALVVASDFDSPEGTLRVHGVGAPPQAQPAVTVSPHPVVVVLSRLLFALSEHRPRRLSATVLQPASSHDSEGLDELFEQTRSILTFSGDQPQEIFGRQLAFNLLPLPPVTALGEQVRGVLGTDVEVAVQLLQSSVFHGLACSVLVELASPVAADEVARSLARGPSLELVDAPQELGPIDVAGREEILLGAVVTDPGRPEALWLWAVADNLAGSIGNARHLALSLLRDGE